MRTSARLLAISCIALALGTHVFAGEIRSSVSKKQEQETAFIQTMKAFVGAEALDGAIHPSYLCQDGTEVCGDAGPDLQQILMKRPDFIPDEYNFRKVHPGSTCSYRGRSGASNDYSLHIVCYGPGVAGVHVDVQLPEGLWGKFVHDVRDVAENFFKVHALGIKNAHTSEKLLTRNFAKWWRSYKTAYSGIAPAELPSEAMQLLNGPNDRTHSASLAGSAGSGFRSAR